MTTLKKHVLLIDDDKSFGQSLARSFVVYTPYSLKHVDDSTRWREELESYKPDFVLIDLNMPKLNGLEVADAIRKDAKHARTKIMLLTAMRLKSENDDHGQVYDDYDCLSKEELDVEALAELIAGKLKQAS